MIRITLVIGMVVVSLIYNQYSDAFVIKPHHSIDGHKHITGNADTCITMGGKGLLMYDDANNNNMHDHEHEQVLCVPHV
jgi:hypothetical protein